MDDDKLSTLLFIDFKKAFDLVDHEILLQKISIYGATLQWFRSYLSHRSQAVRVNGNTSSLLPVKQGLPQGSIVGPILFLVFINDLPLHIRNSDIDIYADDATLSYSSKWNQPKSAMMEFITDDLLNVDKWAKNNKMVVSDIKTKSMLVCGKRLRNRLNDTDLKLNLELNNTKIKQVNKQKLLGTEIDEDLTYDLHVESLCKKLSKEIGLLKHISPYLKRQQREIYYDAVIKPTLLYGACVWSLN